MTPPIQYSVEQKRAIRKAARCEIARQDFWYYCHLRIPSFYKIDRLFLKDLCSVLQAFIENRIRRNPETDQWEILDRELFYNLNNELIPILYDASGNPASGPYQYEEWEICDLLMLNMPPRHGKSLTGQLFSEWCFGRNNSNKIITISYNERLSGRFSKAVRDGVSLVTVNPDQIVFSDVFPGVNIKKGDASAQLWSLEGQYFSYMGGSPTGTLTGAGCNIGFIDDIIKNKYEAYNANVLDGHYEFYTDTYLSRLEEGAKQIMIMTRWSTNDLCGKVYKADPRKAFVYTKKAKDEEGNMLCNEILTSKSLQSKIDLGMSRQIVLANYQQQPIDDEGRLYKSFRTYEDRPVEFEKIACRIDTADEGDDFLCAIIFGVYMDQAYVIDILFTEDPAEVTEPKLAAMIKTNLVNHALFESNNGGKSYSRMVEIECKKLDYTMCVFDWFHETRNKEARILSNATWVMMNILFPANWMHRWPEYYEAMNTYQKAGKNQADDAPDCTTGVAEYFNDTDISRSKSRLAMLCS